MNENKDDHQCCGGHNHEEGGCGCNGDSSHDGCGCGHNHDEQAEYITLTLEDGEEHKCAILGTFEVSDFPEKEYIALLPEGSDEVIVFSFTVDDEELTLDPLLDEEFQTVADEFMSLFGEENFESQE